MKGVQLSLGVLMGNLSADSYFLCILTCLINYICRAAPVGAPMRLKRHYFPKLFSEWSQEEGKTTVIYCGTDQCCLYSHRDKKC